MSIREIKNYPVNSGTGMSIKEAFDVVNANFNYLTIEAIPEQVADSIADLSANLSTTFTGGNISSATRILSDTDSTSITNGAFVVDGGVGIAGNVNIGEMLTVDRVSITRDISAANASITSNVSTTNLAVSGSTFVNSITANTVDVSSSSTLQDTRNNGNLEVIGETLFRANLFLTGAAGINAAARLRANTIVATSSNDSFDTSTGAFLVPNGGMGVAGNVNIGGNLKIGGLATVGNSYVPVSPSSTGIAGQMTWDQDYFYICVGTDQWIRFAKDTGAW